MSSEFDTEVYEFLNLARNTPELTGAFFQEAIDSFDGTYVSIEGRQIATEEGTTAWEEARDNVYPP